MLKKIFWVGIGIGVGALAYRKLSEAKDMASPAGLNRAVGRLGDEAAATLAAFRHGMTSKEAELRASLGLDPTDSGSAGRHAASREN
ncbi:hypothetical protein [Zhihengliuella flava]|uniref:Uncharacterized protein n=1 Tax=Zhihengliuella flava TaxID=1285193 RepID=A0A931GEF0_9MICC|nr:hypothetical protein [Zhihengliuella flava]MBG6083447.1 hypothetical protein [Zhihengliuella flava]